MGKSDTGTSLPHLWRKPVVWSAGGRRYMPLHESGI